MSDKSNLTLFFFSSSLPVFSIEEKKTGDSPPFAIYYLFIVQYNNSLDFISYKMTATTTTALPKNQTGVYAGNSLEEIKPVRAQINGIPISSLQQRSGASVKHLMEQNRLVKNALQAYYPYVTTRGVRNGFRPSIVRHQKSRLSTTISPRESRENSSKDLYPSTPTSARLKSEIDQLNSQLKIYGDLNRILRSQNERVGKLDALFIFEQKKKYKELRFFGLNICSSPISH